MKRIIFNIIIIILIFSSVGCVTLSRFDQERLQELKNVGISETEVQKKNPGIAGGLNLLPGFGNFYLAVGTNESEQWLFGFLNLLTWPWSVIWGVPSGVIDANTINKKETIYYYTYDKFGKIELQKKLVEGNITSSAIKSE